MSKGFQRVIICGNCGKTPEVRSTGSGKLVANFSVAVSERKDGPTEWFNCLGWDKTAEVIRDWVQKGTNVLIEGRLQTRSWDSENGKQYRVELIVDKMCLLGGGEKSEKPAGSFKNVHGLEVSDDDLPSFDDAVPF